MRSANRRGARLAGVVAGLVGAALLVGVAAADEGYATWYGPGFQGSRMANGQPFDQNDPATTANNEYPMGTWLRVTNPANGRSVVVQVRDRGGFGAGLDLSRAAFFALDPPNSWGFRVRYERVAGPDAPPAPKVAPKPPDPPATQSAAVRPPPRTEAKPAGPAPKPPAPAAEPPRAEPSTRGGRQAPTVEHVVAPGETLRAIAEANETSISRLLDLNELDDADVIRAGQVIRLPARFKLYVVQPGDTLNAIAAAAGLDRSTILSSNEIGDPDVLAPGQELRIPA
jgi:rare lipoprotein A (peptidoglycan hydrolase)